MTTPSSRIESAPESGGHSSQSCSRAGARVIRRSLNPDLPIVSGIKSAFPDLSNHTVALSVRNTERNEDDDGKTNVRDGRNNYFIFRPFSVGGNTCVDGF